MTEMAFTEDRINQLWSKVESTPSVFSMLDGHTREGFARLLLHADHVFEYDFGYVRISDLAPGKCAVAHGVFWSPTIYRNLDKLREDAKMFIAKNDLRYLLVVVPSTVRSLRRLLTALQFQEGPILEDYYKIPTGRVDGQMYFLAEEVADEWKI